MIKSTYDRVHPSLYAAAFCIFLLVPVQVSAHEKGNALHKVRLNVNTSDTALETNEPSGCMGKVSRPNMAEAGCVRFAEGLSDSVEFMLTPSKICKPADSQSPVVHWSLDGVQLANVNGLKPSSWPAINDSLDPRAIRDFETDPSTGWIIDIDGPGSSIKIENKNISATSYYVWYRVRASCEGTSVPSIYLDPRMDNEGTR